MPGYSGTRGYERYRGYEKYRRYERVREGIPRIFTLAYPGYSPPSRTPDIHPPRVPRIQVLRATYWIIGEFALKEVDIRAAMAAIRRGVGAIPILGKVGVRWGGVKFHFRCKFCH